MSVPKSATSAKPSPNKDIGSYHARVLIGNFTGILAGSWPTHLATLGRDPQNTDVIALYEGLPQSVKDTIQSYCNHLKSGGRYKKPSTSKGVGNLGNEDILSYSSEIGLVVTTAPVNRARGHVVDTGKTNELNDEKKSQ